MRQGRSIAIRITCQLMAPRGNFLLHHPFGAPRMHHYLQQLRCSRATARRTPYRAHISTNRPARTQEAVEYGYSVGFTASAMLGQPPKLQRRADMRTPKEVTVLLRSMESGYVIPYGGYIASYENGPRDAARLSCGWGRMYSASKVGVQAGGEGRKQGMVPSCLGVPSVLGTCRVPSL